MDDDVDGPTDGGIAQDLILGVPPVVGDVGHLRIVDHDQQIKIRQVAVLRLIDPVAPRIGTEENDLQHHPAAPPLLRTAPAAVLGRLEPGQQSVAHALKLALLPLRKMMQIRPHLLSLTENAPAASANGYVGRNIRFNGDLWPST
ncbi:hypothetical protein D3C86_872560 [compost metagenome]